MANETTATTVEEIVGTEWIVPRIMAAAKQFAVATPFCQQFSLIGKGAGVASVAREVSDTGTLSDFDGPGEATTLSNIQFDMSATAITPTEFGVRRQVTDIAVEDNILGGLLYDYLTNIAARDLAIALDDDVCALFPSLATSVGTSGVDLTIATMAQGLAQLRKNETRAPNGVVFILDDQQAEDYELSLQAATGTTLAGMYERDSKMGLDNGYLGKFNGQPVWQTGLCDTADAGANVVGAVFATGANMDTACFGLAISRLPRPAIDRDEGLRATGVITTMRAGVAEIMDLSGVKIVTDA